MEKGLESRASANLLPAREALPLPILGLTCPGDPSDPNRRDGQDLKAGAHQHGIDDVLVPLPAAGSDGLGQQQGVLGLLRCLQDQPGIGHGIPRLELRALMTMRGTALSARRAAGAASQASSRAPNSGLPPSEA